MEHTLTRNGQSYTCLCCHRVMESQDEYDGISCAVETDCGDTAGQQDADSGAR
jgi:hypothetical protein